MKHITIIKLELNNWNGFIFNILDIEYKRFHGRLFGICFAEDFFHFSILFYQFTIESPFNR